MQRKTIVIHSSALVIVAVIFFFCGFLYGRKDIRMYKKVLKAENQSGKEVSFESTEVYPKSWPTYNLPVVEFSSIAQCILNDNIEIAKKRLRAFIQITKDDAVLRYNIASEEEKRRIQPIIDKATEILEKLDENLDKNKESLSEK